MSQKPNFMMSVLAWGSRQTKSDEFITSYMLLSLCLRPLLFCRSVCGFAPTDLSFFLSLFPFPSLLFHQPNQFHLAAVYLPLSFRSVSSPSLHHLQFVEFTIYFACAPVSSLFLICLVDLVSQLGLCPLAPADSRFGPSDRLQNRKPKCVLFFLHFWWFNVLHTAVESFIFTTLDAKKLSSKDKSEMSEFLFFFHAASPNWKILQW